jgi:hypothetical protein
LRAGAIQRAGVTCLSLHDGCNVKRTRLVDERPRRGQREGMHETEPRHRDDFDAEGWPPDDFSADLGHGEEPNDTGAPDEATRALRHHERPQLNDLLTEEERDRLYVLREDAILEQGTTYVDLARLAVAPFVAIGGRTARPGETLVSKRAVDHELWNKLAQDRSPIQEVPMTGERRDSRSG